MGAILMESTAAIFKLITGQTQAWALLLLTCVHLGSLSAVMRNSQTSMDNLVNVYGSAKVRIQYTLVEEPCFSKTHFWASFWFLVSQ